MDDRTSGPVPLAAPAAQIRRRIRVRLRKRSIPRAMVSRAPSYPHVVRATGDAWMGADQVRRQYRADESFPHVFDKTAGGSRVQVRRR